MKGVLAAAALLVTFGTGTAWARPVVVSAKLADVEDRIKAVAEKANQIVQEHNAYLPTANALVDDYNGCLHYVQMGLLRGDCSLDAAQLNAAETLLDQMKSTYLELTTQLDGLYAERTMLRILLDGRKAGALTR
jgi:uncharacterized protein YoxC